MPNSTLTTMLTSTRSGSSTTVATPWRIFWREAENTHFTDSFGTQLSDLYGQNRWALIGRAEKLWNDNVSPLIEALVLEKWEKIHKKCRTSPATILHHCWMIGRDKTHAWPTVVVCCTIKDIIDRTAKVIANNKRVKEFGFKLMGVLTSELTLRTSAEEMFVRLPRNDLRGRPWNLCGRHIWVNNSARQATIGGVITADGRCFGLTVAHAFFEADMPVEPTATNPPQLFYYDLDVSSDDSTLSSDEEEEEENMQDFAIGNEDRPSDPPSALLRKVAKNGNTHLTL